MVLISLCAARGPSYDRAMFFDESAPGVANRKAQGTNNKKLQRRDVPFVRQVWSHGMAPQARSYVDHTWSDSTCIYRLIAPHAFLMRTPYVTITSLISWESQSIRKRCNLLSSVAPGAPYKIEAEK